MALGRTRAAADLAGALVSQELAPRLGAPHAHEVPGVGRGALRRLAVAGGAGAAHVLLAHRPAAAAATARRLVPAAAELARRGGGIVAGARHAGRGVAAEPRGAARRARPHRGAALQARAGSRAERRVPLAQAHAAVVRALRERRVVRAWGAGPMAALRGGGGAAARPHPWCSHAAAPQCSASQQRAAHLSRRGARAPPQRRGPRRRPATRTGAGAHRAPPWRRPAARARCALAARPAARRRRACRVSRPARGAESRASSAHKARIDGQAPPQAAPRAPRRAPHVLLPPPPRRVALAAPRLAPGPTRTFDGPVMPHSGATASPSGQPLPARSQRRGCSRPGDHGSSEAWSHAV
jgi:hypothetical protein